MRSEWLHLGLIEITTQGITDMPYTIEEIPNIKAALKNISYDTCLVLDLDNTVMESSLELGGDQWFSGMLKHAIQVESNNEIAFASVLLIYYAVQNHVRTKAVEPEISKIIRALQDIGIPVIALTARGHSIMQPTIRQLNAIGIDFSRRSMSTESSVSYEQGIIFCNGQNKGSALDGFLKKCSYLPRHIVMLDDKKTHLAHVMDAVEALGIRFSGFRYGFLDEKVTQFNMQIASHQLAHLKKRLSSDVQTAIDQLQLIPHDVDMVSTAASCLDGFFHHTNPSLPAPSDEPVINGLGCV